MNVQLVPAKLVQFGFRPVDVLDAIQTAYQGSAVAQIYDGSRLFDVSVILQSKDRRRPEEIKNLLLRNAVGEMMPRGGLASVGILPGRGAICQHVARPGQVGART